MTKLYNQNYIFLIWVSVTFGATLPPLFLPQEGCQHMDRDFKRLIEWTLREIEVDGDGVQHAEVKAVFGLHFAPWLVVRRAAIVNMRKIIHRHHPQNGTAQIHQGLCGTAA